jgi:hypothetical protein
VFSGEEELIHTYPWSLCVQPTIVTMSGPSATYSYYALCEVRGHGLGEQKARDEKVVTFLCVRI